MKTIQIFTAGLLALLLLGSHSANAVDEKSGLSQPINNTISHLDSALKGLDANELEAAQEHMKAAAQSSKNIVGGSFEVKAQRGARVIANARRQTKEGNKDGAIVSLQEALQIYKSFHQPGSTGGRGGLN
ncbi:MAG: hypothetical protein ACU841_12870 [Gammaproteobacteria bacterium]